jgi:hypothetical protein
MHKAMTEPYRLLCGAKTGYLTAAEVMEQQQ